MFELVEKFNKEVIGIDRETGAIQDEKEFDWFIGVLLEEIEQELIPAFKQKDFVAQLDAVTDLIYFAAGFYTRNGVDSDTAMEIFESVHAANMMKKKGVKKERDVQHENDAIKPEGWVAPEKEIMRILSSQRKNENRN